MEHDYELIAQELSTLAERFMRVENRVADLLTRMADVEKVNARLEMNKPAAQIIVNKTKAVP